MSVRVQVVVNRSGEKHLRNWRIRRGAELPEFRRAGGDDYVDGKDGWVCVDEDYDQARAFYEGKLGFTFVALTPFALLMRAGENLIRVVKMADFVPLRSTVLGWEISDIEAVVGWLAERGVETEKYPWVADKERGIWTTPGGDKVAWFKDPDGNVLSVSQHR